MQAEGAENDSEKDIFLIAGLTLLAAVLLWTIPALRSKAPEIAALYLRYSLNGQAAEVIPLTVVGRHGHESHEKTTIRNTAFPFIGLNVFCTNAL